MIEEPKKIILPDSSGKGNHIPIAVNWNKKVKNCGYVKFFLPDGKETIVKKDYLRTIMFMLANEEEQQRMAQRRIVTVRTINQMMEVTAKKNIEKGEKIMFPVTIQVPVYMQDKVIEDSPLIKG